uniref:Uncharacterized protein n=1 Tax=Arundo donax TaxID=35708 RepID=A0A0A9HGN1_ARUDO
MASIAILSSTSSVVPSLMARHSPRAWSITFISTTQSP